MARKNIVVVEVKPPIPTHAFDFCAYLAGSDEDSLYGWGESEEEARDDLGVLMADYFEEEEDAEVEE